MEKDIQEEIKKLKKELVFLRISKITKQKATVHEIKKIQNKISKLNQLNHTRNILKT